MTQRNQTVIEVETSLRPVGPNADIMPNWAHLRYDPADPYAVHLSFDHDESYETVTWSFARELLATGLDEPAGIGDLRLFPWRGPRGEFIALSLSSPDGSALFEVARSVLARFLRRTYAAVPRGQETEHLDIDGALAWLLGEWS
jgi:hypothetical protein